MRLGVYRPVEEHSRTVPRILVCLLLFGLLLFNPFAALTSASNHPGFSTSPRHRATVGASEMQHFSPVKSEITTPDIAQVVHSMDVKVTPAESKPRTILLEELPPMPALIVSVWFRPPPAL
jgi:hypothetical protein